MEHRKKILTDADLTERAVEDAIEQLHKYLQEEEVKTFTSCPSDLNCHLRASLFAYEVAARISFMNENLSLELTKNLPMDSFEVSYQTYNFDKEVSVIGDTYTIYSEGA